jgi:hypothetical protein
VNMHHKLDQRVLELGFSGRSIEEVLAVKSDWPEDIVPVQKRGTASLAIRVPPVDMTLGLAAQLPAIEEALAAAYKLMPYSPLLKGPRS